MAAMCTSSETYKIKHAENTNTFYVVKTNDDATCSVEASTQIQIEFSVSKTKVYQVLAVLKNYVYKGLDDDHPEFKSISRQNLIDCCQISGKEFDNLNTKSINEHLRIYQISKDQYCLFDDKCFYELLEDVIMVLNAKLGSEASVSLEAVW